jgi:predicted HTH transcriptional regulator
MQRLIGRMAEAGRITNAGYRDAFDVERLEARRALAALVAQGVFQLAGERRGAHYLPGPSWPPAQE